MIAKVIGNNSNLTSKLFVNIIETVKYNAETKEKTLKILSAFFTPLRLTFFPIKKKTTQITEENKSANPTKISKCNPKKSSATIFFRKVRRISHSPLELQ